MSAGATDGYFRAALADLGVTLDDGDALHVDRTENVPAALGVWYRVAGRSYVNAAHNRIFGPHELRKVDGKVVFAEENQDVVVWAFDSHTNLDDPPVWQGQPNGSNSGGIAWYSEELPLSRFLIEMLRHTLTHDPPAP